MILVTTCSAKDNSITNLMMAVILFYLFKELHIRSRFINKAAANVFAVFALNDVLVTVVMERLLDSGFKSGGGVSVGSTLSSVNSTNSSLPNSICFSASINFCI